MYENSVAFSSSHYSFTIQQYSVHIVHLSLFISISLHKKERRKDLKIWSMMIIDDSIHCQCRVHCYDTTSFSVDVDTAGITCAFSFFYTILAAYLFLVIIIIIIFIWMTMLNPSSFSFDHHHYTLQYYLASQKKKTGKVVVDTLNMNLTGKRNAFLSLVSSRLTYNFVCLPFCNNIIRYLVMLIGFSNKHSKEKLISSGNSSTGAGAFHLQNILIWSSSL